MALHLAGRLYHLIIDPMLRKVRKDLVNLIPERVNVLEIASGSGAQAMALAGNGCDVLGVDLNSGMVAYADSRVPDELRNRLSYLSADGRSLSFLTGRNYDYAVICLALHAMDPSDRIPVLREMSRAAKTLVVADYSVPLPQSPGGFLAGMIERIAGGDHWAGYKDYQRSGGIEALAPGVGLAVLERRSSLSGIVTLWVMQSGVS